MSLLHRDALETLRNWTPTPDGADDWRLTMKLLESGPEVMWRDHDGGHVTASVIILSHDRRRVLLCLHGKFDVWVQLGGHLEAGDASLAAAALREATEESGIAGLVVDPVPVDVDIHQVVNCAGRRLDHHDVIFAVHAPRDAVEQVSAESHALGWFRPDALPAPLGSDTRRVVRNAMLRAAVR
ncbi:NUDIX domain-containing protein [Polymorphospora sp. NPDC051019]|uniref:NUDIX domain-containing protein n=1 Tax=Polymorphospora sp. NPDC051019 TaxID=3155725 RepID=UPI003436A411